MAGTIFFLLCLESIKSQKERYRQINSEEKCELLKNEFELIFLPKKETPLSNNGRAWFVAPSIGEIVF